MSNPASWVRPEHRTALILSSNYYTAPIHNFEGWKLISQSVRIGVYQKGNEYIVVCKGTTPTNIQDVFDDARIAGFMGGEITIDQEARKAVNKIRAGDKGASILITGHSLGGRAALTVAKEQDLKAVVFNPAAPFINPLTNGPGSDKATSYHINGDLISSHVSPDATEVIRVDMGYNPFQTIDAHTMSNFYGDKPVYGFKSVDQEDVFLHANLALAALALIDNNALREMREISARISATPLPNSLRSYKHTGSDIESVIVNTGIGLIAIGSKINTIDFEIRVIQSNLLKVPETGLKLGPKLRKILLATDTINVVNNLANAANHFASSLQHVNLPAAAANYSELQAGVDRLNKIRKELFNSKAQVKVSDVTLTTNKVLAPSEIFDKADLQMIGIEDDHLAKMEMSTKSPNPAVYLEEAADAIPPQPEKLNKLHEKRLFSDRVTGARRRARELFKNNPLTRLQARVGRIKKNAKLVKESAKIAVKQRLFQAGQKLIRKSPSAAKLVGRITVASNMFRRFAQIAAKVSVKTFKVLLTAFAVFDLAYTTYLLVDAFRKNNFDDVIEHITFFTPAEWEGIAKATANFFTNVAKEVADFFVGVHPSEDKCKPGSALYWDTKQKTCLPNPCGKKDGVWGVYNQDGKTCSFSVPSQFSPNLNPVALVYDYAAATGERATSKAEDDASAIAEQQAALQQFKPGVFESIGSFFTELFK